MKCMNVGNLENYNKAAYYFANSNSPNAKEMYDEAVKRAVNYKAEKLMNAEKPKKNYVKSVIEALESIGENERAVQLRDKFRL